MPRFSICVSSYNDAEYLPACLDSVLNQSFSNIELIVVDDGSPDNTAEILKAYSQRDSRVRPIIKTANEGVHLGRKAAVSAATSDYVIFLDSDDELRPGFLSGLDSVLAHCSAEIIHFGIDVINAGVTDDECEVFESYVNKTVDYLEGGEIIRSCIYTTAQVII